MANMGRAHKSLNVRKKPLGLFSKEPMTGFYRNGYCDVGVEDTGNHSVAATLTDPFLDFTASRGNNLRSIGLTAGCKWCLCAARWKEALDHAAKAHDDTPSIVPKVHLHATHERALDVVSMAELRKHAAEGEAGNMRSLNAEFGDVVPLRNQRRENNGPAGLKTKERTELADRKEMTARYDEKEL